MIGKEKLWHIKKYNEEKADTIAAALGISPMIVGVLLERGFKDEQSIREYLYGSKHPFHDPFLLKGMGTAVARIEEAIRTNERITVYGDYDVDGITASSLLYIYLRKRGAAVDTYIPRRESEGYGLNDEALKHLSDLGTGLIITVDCGISSFSEVRQASKNLDIIITDHHTVPEQLPPAYAIVNPKQRECEYPFKDLSGVGIAFKLCQAMEQGALGLLPEWEGLTELVALGTIADIVPLTGENRELVRRGLQALKTTELVGVKYLLDICGCSPDNITSENIGFRIAPRLNAAGRLEHAQSAVELLITNDEERAQEIAERLNCENSRRQEISKQILAEAEAMLARELHLDTAIVLASEDWHQGVIGIVASRLVDKYHLPAILFSLSDGVAKGSCRSIPALNIYDAIASASDLIIQFGGHRQAAGLTMDAKNIPEFRDRFRKYVEQHLRAEDFHPTLTVDCVVESGKKISMGEMKELALLEPCGCANPYPVFAFKNSQIRGPRTMGAEGRHLTFTAGKADSAYRAVMWNSGAFLPYLCGGIEADIAFVPRINVFNNETSIQLHVLAIKKDVMLCDLRAASDDKLHVLKTFIRENDAVCICLSSFDGVLRRQLLEWDNNVERYVRFASYKNLPDSFPQHEKVILYDLPEHRVDDILRDLVKNGAREIILLYNKRDYSAAYEHLRNASLDSVKMADAYKKVMSVLKAHGAVPMKQLLNEDDDPVLSAALQIMEELRFITVEGGFVSRGNIVKRSLDESQLYSRLRKENKHMELNLRDNLSRSLYV